MAVARYLASAAASTVELFQADCGVIEFVLTEFEVPNEFVAETENVYLVPFFNPEIVTGLSETLTTFPV